jgi:hypothetical protein
VANLETLTAEQEAELPKIRDEWIEAGLSCAPANRELAVQGVNMAYEAAGLKPPHMARFPTSWGIRCHTNPRTPEESPDGLGARPDAGPGPEGVEVTDLVETTDKSLIRHYAHSDQLNRWGNGNGGKAICGGLLYVWDQEYMDSRVSAGLQRDPVAVSNLPLCQRCERKGASLYDSID